MPNDCWNKITIKATTDQIKQILTTEFKDCPKRCFELLQVGEEALQFKYWSAWRPDLNFMHYLVQNYDNIWIKNQWYEEGGMCGIIIETEKDIQAMRWFDGDDLEWHYRFKECDMPEVVLGKDEDEDEIALIKKELEEKQLEEKESTKSENQNIIIIQSPEILKSKD